MKKMFIILTVCIITLTYTIAYAENNNDEWIIGDVFLARPIGLAAVVFGTAVFVISSPISLLTGDTTKVAEELIADPWDYTFNRPLGDFEYQTDTY